jgi:hypothetical protein
MENIPYSRRLIKGDLSVIFYFSIVKLLLHLVTNAFGGYGLFRDELYYLACADNLAAGYVDQPPLSVYLLKLTTLLFGDSLFVIRLPVAIAGALNVWFIGLITRRIGGGTVAVFIACLFSFSPGNIVMASFYSMNALEILSWTMTAYVLVRIIQDGKKRDWIYLGLVLGLGLLNKIGVLFLGAGIFAGLVLTPERRWFTTVWPYAAGAIAFLLFSPYVFWNIQNDYAHLEFIASASAGKYSGLSVITFASGQLLLNHPIAVLIWMPGLIALFVHPALRQYRLLGWLYVVPLFILLINRTSKDVYLLPAYGVLWAAGGFFAESLIKRFRYMRWVVGVVAAVWLAVLVALLPMVLPVLPVGKYISYADRMGFKPESPEGKRVSELPQFYADMFGWEEKAEAVAAAYHSLSQDEKEKCAIFSNNYGRCGAIDYFGRQYGLPRSIGSHNNYWIWGPRHYTGEIIIVIGGRYEDYENNFEEVQQFSVSHCRYCMPYEDDVPIFICRGLKGSLPEIWASQKHYD